MKFYCSIRSTIARTGAFTLGVAVVLYASYRAGQAYAEWERPPATASDDAADAIRMNSLSGALSAGGHWSFANLDWEICSHVIPAENVEPQIARSISNSSRSDADLAHIPDASPELLRFIKSANLVPTVTNSAEIYRLERPTLKAVIILRKIENRMKAVGGILAYSQNDRDWQSFEFTPRSNSTILANSFHLLPLPASAIQTGARTDAEGRLLLEMIATKSSAASLLDDWKQAGWEVQPTAIREDSSFSYLCARGNEIVYAWSADSGGSLKHLILSHTPTDAVPQTSSITPTN